MAAIPSIEKLLGHAPMQAMVNQYGRQLVTEAARTATDAMRRDIQAGKAANRPIIAGEAVLDALINHTSNWLLAQMQPSLRRVFNQTGTVLHTNLGRAVLSDDAIRAVGQAARWPGNLEFDLASQQRGDRDSHIESLLGQLTGAPAATVVNNNAAAVILVLNSLAAGKEVVVSRGELVEIGGSFRMPDIMRSAGCVLREVGTTNRTHLSDYEQAIGPDTAALMTVDPSNYRIEGFTTSLSKADIADVAHRHGLPLIDDLGSGALTDLQQWGLPHETTVREALASGADIVTFSGDKLLGGPQAGMIVGTAELLSRIRRNPMKRALRVDKLRVAALEATLRHYLTPEKLATELPVLRHLTRDGDAITATAQRVAQHCRQALDGYVTIDIVDCMSQIGSGSLPTDLLPSTAIAIAPVAANRTDPTASAPTLNSLSRALLAMPIPVVGRIANEQLLLDMRTLEEDVEAAFIAQLPALADQLANRPATHEPGTDNDKSPC